MSKFQIQVPAAIRQAFNDTRSWFSKTDVKAEFIPLKVEMEERTDGLIWVGVVYERGLRFYVTYEVENGDIHNCYQPKFVQLWDRISQSSDGNPSEWNKWQWQAGEEGLTKVA